MKYLIRALEELENYVSGEAMDLGLENVNDGYANTNTTGYQEENHFGVHIYFSDLYGALAFLAAVYGAGLFFSRCMGMPALVGEIFVGILMGPNMFDVVPFEEAFVLLGEIGLILLVLEAGIDIDLTTLKLIGFRGTMIAVVGSLLPVAIAICVAYGLGYEGVSAIAVGCTFAPTSLGIAMNVLRRAGIVNTPTGQLIVAAAIIDDMIALVVLSQLQSFTSPELSVVDMVVPVVSAVAFLVGGGAVAVLIVPKVLEKYVFEPVDKYTRFDRDWLAIAIMLSFLLALVPTTYFAKASPLMGAFLAGLAFCSNDGAHHMFVSQFKRLMQWLLRIFFAASIGFQVPLQKFASAKVLLEGLLFLSPLLGKVAVGFMVPNFGSSHKFRYTHLRDCLLVGFSMAAEGEFAFVIAVFGVSNNLFPKDLYASVVLAVLMSTIVAPFGLQRTLAYYNRKIKRDVFGSSDTTEHSTATLRERLRDNNVLFWCIQIKSAPAWGLQTKIVEELTQLNLDLIDHRAWHPRQSLDTLLNEIYAKDDTIVLQGLSDDEADSKLRERKTSIKDAIKEAIGQDGAMVEVERWTPHIAYDETTGGDASEHIALATSAALEASMRFHGSARAGGDKGGSDDDDEDLESTKEESDSESQTQEETIAENGRRTTLRFSRICSGRLEGMFRQDRRHGGEGGGSRNMIGYGGYDSDEEGLDHHGRVVPPRRDPSGRRAIDQQDENIEVVYERV